MEIKQFNDPCLGHYSYAIVSNHKMALIDPARNPQPYYDFAQKKNAQITYVIETHPHADFVSSHLEIHKKTKAEILVSKKVGVEYPHHPFDEGDIVSLGEIKLKALDTPGHSPDSICIVAIDKQEIPQVIFTGDTLFIGDCGRPDLREKIGNITSHREQLAKQMFHSLRVKLFPLSDSIRVYPTHGAGSLCGKLLSSFNISTLGSEKIENWSLQPMMEDQFIKTLLTDQPHIPKYFPYCVDTNRKGAPSLSDSLIEANHVKQVSSYNNSFLAIDTRDREKFYHGHIKNSVNMMEGPSFETWLGSIIDPQERFYLISETEDQLKRMVDRVAKIGYERQIEASIIYSPSSNEVQSPRLDSKWLQTRAHEFTILDVRNSKEVHTQKIFSKAISIPLHELRERIHEIPTDNPIVVHCARGYRSAIGASLLTSCLNHSLEVYDLGPDITLFTAPVHEKKLT